MVMTSAIWKLPAHEKADESHEKQTDEWQWMSPNPFPGQCDRCDQWSVGHNYILVTIRWSHVYKYVCPAGAGVIRRRGTCSAGLTPLNSITHPSLHPPLLNFATIHVVPSPHPHTPPVTPFDHPNGQNLQWQKVQIGQRDPLHAVHWLNSFNNCTSKNQHQPKPISKRQNCRGRQHQLQCWCHSPHEQGVGKPPWWSPGQQTSFIHANCAHHSIAYCAHHSFVLLWCALPMMKCA